MKKIMNLMVAFAATAICAVPMTSSAVGKIGILKYDVNKDDMVDSIDASMVLKEYVARSCDKPTTLTNTQKYIADTNDDGKIDAIDASKILKVYAANSAGEEVPTVLVSFVPVIKREKSLKTYSAMNDYDEAYDFLMAEKGDNYWSAYIQRMEISSDISVPTQLRTIYRDERVKY